MKWLLLFLLWAGPSWAVTPGEMLADPVLEARARVISQGLRCPVCQNETIDESAATVAADLRLLVRERLLLGDSDAAVLAYVVARYGEFVLLRPVRKGGNWILWLAGPGLLVLGGAVAWTAIRRVKMVEKSPELSEEEVRKVLEVMDKMS